MSKKYTKGRWMQFGTNAAHTGIVIKPFLGRSESIALCFNHYSNVEANARLIAAAPELDQALQALVAFLEQHKASLIGNECTGQEYERVLKPAITALGRVRGESK